MRVRRIGWGVPARAIITLIVALGAGAALAGPAGASPAAQKYPESHLWTFGQATVFGSRPSTPQPIHGLPAGQHVVGAAFEPSTVFIGSVAAYFLLGNGTVWGPLRRGAKQAEVPGLTGITSISAVGKVLYGLSGTGDVYSQTGTGSATQVTGVSEVTAIVNGYALEDDGTVWALGGAAPVQVDVPGVVAQISSNPCGASSYALTSTGSIYAWGANDYGQLGNGTTTDSATPVLVQRISNAAQVIGGCRDAYAILKGTGKVRAWGQGSQGELGNGHRYVSALPVLVSTLTGVTSVVPGWETTYAVEKNGTVWTWGFNRTGQLGYRTAGDYGDLPGKVPGIGAPVASVAASTTKYTEQNYAVALGRNGTLWGPWPANGLHGSSHQVTRTPMFPPATKLWLNPFGGVGWGYGGAVYFAD